MTKQPPFNTDELADYLDKYLPPGKSNTPETDENPLVDAAIRLANDSAPPSLSPDAFARIQAQVLEKNRQLHPVTETENAPISDKIIQFPTTAFIRFMGNIAAIFLAVMIPIASAQSVPGNPLYPVKRGFERIELAAAVPLDKQANIYLAHAKRRAREAIILSSRGIPNQHLIEESSNNLKRAANSPESIYVATLLEYADETVPDGSSNNIDEPSPLTVADASSQSDGQSPVEDVSATNPDNTLTEDTETESTTPASNGDEMPEVTVDETGADSSQEILAANETTPTPLPPMPENVVPFSEPTPAYVYAYAKRQRSVTTQHQCVHRYTGKTTCFPEHMGDES